MNLPAFKDIGPTPPPAKPFKKILSMQRAGRHAETRVLCEKLEAEGYESADLLHLHGLALRACGDLNGAVVKINNALQRAPENHSIINSLGVVFLQMKENEVAVELFKQATRLNKEFYDGWKNLGIALRTLERYEAAELAFTCAHQLDKTNPEPLLNLVYLLCDVRLYQQAQEFMDQRLLNGDFEVTQSMLIRRLQIAARLQDMEYIETNYLSFDRAGLTTDEEAELDNIWCYFLDLNFRHEEAIPLLEKWAERETVYKGQMTSQLGLCYGQVGRLDEAIKIHEQIVSENPDHVAARYNLADLQIRNGILEEAYDNYEVRWKWREFPSKRRMFDMPRWNGEPLEGKKLLVWREQGIGDEVRFASLMPELEHSGAEVTFEVMPKLAPLWRKNFPWAKIQDEGETECRGDEAYADFDYHVAIGTLRKFFRPTVESFDQLQKPYIKSTPEIESRLRAEMGLSNDDFLVGVCWRSSSINALRMRDMLDITQIQPFGQLADTKWVCLQYDWAPEEVDQLRGYGLDTFNFTDLNQKDDLIGACNLMNACDLVISVGVSVADFAGAVGVPLITIGRKTSDTFMGTSRNPWFPNCKPYPMEPNGGDDVVAKILEDWDDIRSWAKGVKAASRAEFGDLLLGSDEVSERDLLYPISNG